MITMNFQQENAPNMQEACRELYGFPLSETLPDGGDAEVVAIRRGTAEGNPIVMITFTVGVDGNRRRAQTVLTAREFVAAARAIEARYGDLLQ